jgi:hypothetical protein
LKGEHTTVRFPARLAGKGLMMTDGDVSATDRAAETTGSFDSRAGHVAIGELLREQAVVPCRSRVARIFGGSPLNAVTQPLYRGVVGEIEVGEALDRLGPEWHVLHALPVDEDHSDIDHLVIGPSGVFVISTRNHTGADVWASQRTFLVAGVRYPHIRDMEYEMGRAERLLTAAVGRPVEVSGILAVVAAKSLVVREKQRDVAVLESSNLVSWLLRHKRALAPVEVAQVGAAASLASTWYDDGSSALIEPDGQRERFERLRAEVRTAWRVQLAWTIGASMAAVGAFAGMTYSILMSTIGSFGL